jgi:ribosomal-protein-serine acetyltransferase
VFSFQLTAAAELRLLEERHAEELFALVDQNRAYLREWLPWLDQNQSVEATLLFIRSTLQQLAANEGFTAGIFQEGRLAGVIGYHRLNWASRIATIGYWLAAEHQGRGLMTLATRALVDHAFRALQMNRVEIRAAPGNTKSRAIPERLGFVQEGTLRQAERLYERYVDLVVYSMLEREWAGL